MNNLSTIWLCARFNLYKWLVNPRIYALAAVIAAFSLWMFAWVSEYAAAVKVPVSPWIFPFTFTSPIMFPIYGCLTILLYCDAPFIDRHTPFLAIRTNRRNWILGQILYIVISAFIYTVYFAGMSIIALIPNVRWMSDWGAVLKTLAYDPVSPQKYGITHLLNIADPVISSFTTVSAMGISLALFWLVTMFVGLLILCFNVVIGGQAGVVAAGGLTFLSYFSIFVGRLAHGDVIYYFSPINWISMFYLNWVGDPMIPSPWYAVSVLIGGILILSVITVYVSCKQDLDAQERRV